MEQSISRKEIRPIANSAVFSKGMRDGLPIGLGYLAVGFSLGIAAAGAGLSAGQGFLASLLCNASAGQYAGFSIIGANGTYIEIAIITLILNSRYMLMSLAMSQRLKPGTSLPARMLMAFGITDELFAIAIARPGYLKPVYSYGAMLMAMPFWAIGTSLGCTAGNVLPASLVSALGVALFGMFIAVIIPPSKNNKAIACVVAASFLLSGGAAIAPYISTVSAGTRTIILTIVISSAAAVLFPVKNKEEK